MRKLNAADFVGQKFGRWTVLGGERRPTTHQKPALQTLCQCECGTKRWIAIANLRNGRTQSCGCRVKEMHTAMLQRFAPLPKSFTEAA